MNLSRVNETALHLGPVFMDGSLHDQADLLNVLQMDELTAVCLHLHVRDLVRVSETCKRFLDGDSGLETAELPTKLPVITALMEHAFPGGETIPSTRPAGSSESWVAFLARCARQRHCRKAAPIAAGSSYGLFADAAGRLLACGAGGETMGHGEGDREHFYPTPVAAMTGVRVRSVATGADHSLALGWDNRVYSWGYDAEGQLGHEDKLDMMLPMLVSGLECELGIAAAGYHSFAVTQSRIVFHWRDSLQPGAEDELRPIVVEEFGAVRMRSVCASVGAAFTIGEAEELFSRGFGGHGRLGHGDKQHQPSPKRVEALRDIRVSSALTGRVHALALTEDGLVYAWGHNLDRSLLGNPHAEEELLPKPIEALRGVRVDSIAVGDHRSYAVADTGELWAWGFDGDIDSDPPLGHGEKKDCPIPKLIGSLHGIKVDAVAAECYHTLAWADDGSVYTWGLWIAEVRGAPGLSLSVSDAENPQRISALRVAREV
jgi:alpha-tubulin suppressor-like RCC1 family protein